MARQARWRQWMAKPGVKERQGHKARIWRERSKEAIRARAKKWRDATGYNAVLKARRRAREVSAPGVCSRGQVAARWNFYRGRCYLCLGPAEHMDHVKPLARGGSNWPANLRPTCAHCNISKSDYTLDEWTDVLIRRASLVLGITQAVRDV